MALTINEFFETNIWKTIYSEQIIKNLNQAVPISNFIKNKYGLDISASELMIKAREISKLKPKRIRPKKKK